MHLKCIFSIVPHLFQNLMTAALLTFSLHCLFIIWQFKQILLDTSGGVFRGILFNYLLFGILILQMHSGRQIHVYFFPYGQAAGPLRLLPAGPPPITLDNKKGLWAAESWRGKEVVLRIFIIMEEKGDTEMKSSIQTFLAVPPPHPVCCPGT